MLSVTTYLPAGLGELGDIDSVTESRDEADQTLCGQVTVAQNYIQDI